MPKTIMLYGESGSTKTTQCYLLAKWLRDKWVKEKKKKTIRLFCTDGGGYNPFTDSGMIDEGFVEVLDISASNLLHVESMAVGDGRWPDENGYRGGDTDWLEYDREYVKNNIGAYIVEGFDSLANRWKSHMARKEETAGFKHSYSYEEESPNLGKYKLGGLQEGHYGMVHTQLEIWWNTQMRQLPVEYIIATSLVEKSKEKKGRGSMGLRSCYGPSSVGQAQVRQIPQWFEDCWHLEDKEFNSGGKSVTAKVAWFRSHIDSETECEYLAKVRVLPEKLGQLDAFAKGRDFFILSKGTNEKYPTGVERFYQWRDEKLNVG